MDGGIRWINLDAPESTKNILHHRKGTYGICATDSHVYSIGGDGVLTKWDKKLGRALESIQLSRQALRSLDYCSVRQELAIGSADCNIYLLDVDLRLKQTIQNAHNQTVFSVRYAPDAQYLISGGRDAFLNVWQSVEYSSPKNYLPFELKSSQAAHIATINDLVFHPNGHLLATASRDKTIKIWETQTWKLLKVINTVRNGGHLNSVNALLWTSQGLVSASDDRSIILWSIEV